MPVSFAATRKEIRIIAEIVQRATKLDPSFKTTVLYMDIRATHANGCRLNLAKLLKADDFNFMHDVFGIFRHLDRVTGKLSNHFLPRSYDAGKKKRK